MYKYIKMVLDKNKTVTLKVKEDALELIDKAAKEQFCSRTSFMVRNSVEAGKKVLGEVS